MDQKTLAALRAGTADVQVTRDRRTIAVLLDGEIREQLEMIAAQVEQLDREQTAPRLRRMTEKSDPALRAELVAKAEALWQQAAGHTMHVVVQALPGTDFQALQGKYPPRKLEDGTVEPTDARWDVDTEGVIEPLLKACIVGHRPDKDSRELLTLTPEDIDWLLGAVSFRQTQDLLVAALIVNKVDAALPLPRPRPSKTPESAAE